jgi:Kef-type K+ transport system membrane component KefB
MISRIWERTCWGSVGSCVLCAICLLVIDAGVAFASTGAAADGHKVIAHIAMSLVAAAVFAFLMKILRQPLLLGYILAGVAIGPVGLRLITNEADIVTIAEIGLILLLFMIGLEINVRGMLKAGRKVIIPGLLQFPLSVAAAYGCLLLLENVGIDVGVGTYARLYVAIAVSLSSTMIVVKLLFDKMEIDTLSGRITIGILVFQDIWAIIVLAFQPNLNDPQVMGIVRTFGFGALLVIAALLTSRFVLPRVFRAAAKLPELVLVLAMGWCLLVALVAAQPLVGLSMEMGALIAGVSLATFPYNIDVVAKATVVRDFFITLYFVALGMVIPVPTVKVLLVALVIVGIVLLLRFLGVFAVLYSLKSGLRVSNLAAINLSQVSEFSLVVLSLGVGFGHIEQDTLTYGIWVFALLAVISTYFILYSHGLQTFLVRVERAMAIPDISGPHDEEKAARGHSVVILGFFRVASQFLKEIQRRQPDLLQQLLVVDFNPEVKQKLDELGVDCLYGDVSHLDTLQHANLHDASIVLSTIPDAFLKGVTNEKLMRIVRGLAPEAIVAVTAESATQARRLYACGADYVLQPSEAAAINLASVVERSFKGELPAVRQVELDRLDAEGAEVLS